MKYTLLELVQDILSSMDSDEITSINDTVESQQVAKIVRTVYFDIINKARLPEHFDLRQLDEVSDINTPVLLTIPEDVSQIVNLKYDYATITQPDINMQKVEFMPLLDFLDRQDRLNPTGVDVGSMSLTISGDSHTLLFNTLAAPRYYTTTDDNQVIFDSYDSAVDTFLLGSKTRAYCRLVIPWTMADSFTPDMDEPQFPLLLNEAKSLAWAELKQSPHPKAEQSARRAWSQLQRNKYRTEQLTDFDRLPSFGRKY